MGGAAGHMAHLHEDLDLTFNDLVSIINEAASGELQVVEKVDGQNLFLTVNAQGEIRAARNPTQIKTGGMSTVEYAEKWLGHPAEGAFMNGFKAIELALNSLDPQLIMNLFAGGRRYVNMEIMYPPSPNIINYGASYVVLHNFNTYDPAGAPVDDPSAQQAFQMLAKALNAAEVQVDDESWRIYGPQLIPLNNIANGAPHQAAIAAIANIAQPVGMDGTIGDLAHIRYKELVTGAGIPEHVADELIKKSFDLPGAKSLHNIKKMVPKEMQKEVSNLGTKTNAKKAISIALRPLEKIISDFAIEVLKGIKSFFVVDHEKSVKAMKDELIDSIAKLKEIAESGDEKIGALIDKQLAKLGDIEANVNSSLEGVVFEKNGQIYKLTGSFAMINQLIGKARRIDESITATVREVFIRGTIRAALIKAIAKR